MTSAAETTARAVVATWDATGTGDLRMLMLNVAGAISQAESMAYERAATIAREYAGKANSEQGRVVATGIAFAISALSNPDAANREKGK